MFPIVPCMSPRIVPAQLDPENVRVGETLRGYREKSGLRVGELANELGISYAYLSNIEGGRKRLTPRLAARAASALDVRQAALVRPDLFDDAATA